MSTETAAKPAPAEPRTYGNWRSPRSAGLGRFGLLGTAVIFGGILAGIGAMFLAGLVGALAVAVLTATALALLSLPDRHNLTAGQRILTHVAWAARKRRGTTLYRSGPLSRVPWGSFQLPGVAARSRLFEACDSYGRPMAIIHMPTTNHFSVVISCQPDGAALVDDEQVDAWVAGWGGYLAMLATEGIVAAAVTIETAPDSGARLRREIRGNLSPDTHPLAAAAMDEIMRSYPAAAPSFRAWVSLTVKGVTPSGKRRRPESVIDDLRTRMPNLVGAIAQAGGGAAAPVPAQELCEQVRIAYDPAAADVIADAHAAGAAVQLDWTDVGPAGHETGWDFYRHDGATSVTWSMTAPPRGLSYSSVLFDLLSAHPGITRKRVTLLYRPIPPATAAALVDADHRNAAFRVGSAGRPTARAQTDLAAAQAASREEALGAGLVNFGLLVTATVTDPADLADARAAVTGLGAAARIVLRPVYGAQDSAFAAGLPLGLVTTEHLKVPATLRGLM